MCVEATSAVSAKPTLTISSDGSDGASLRLYCNDVNEVAGFDFITNENAERTVGTEIHYEYVITLDMLTYNSLTQTKKTTIINYALSGINDYTLTTMTKNKVYNFIESQDETTSSLVRQLSDDVNADFAEAYTMFKPFSGVLGLVLGIFTLAIFVVLTLTILTDLSYIVLPIVRDFLTKSDSKPKFVSNEAWYAVREGDKDTSGNVNVLLLYFKKKSMQFAVLALCILYLVSGEIYSMIGNFIDAFRGILE